MEDSLLSFVRGLKCRECHREYESSPIYVCEYCFASLEVNYDYEAIGKVLSRERIENGPNSLWRYKDLLPLDHEPTVGLTSGFTPLIKADNLAEKLGVKELYLKDDSACHPTLSFKDRVVAVALSKAIEFGFDTVACASTGNLANSVSSLAAWAKLKRYIFIPSDLELAKIQGSLVYEPNLIAVKGHYDEVNRLSAEIASKYNWAFVNVNIRPYYAEGSKTFGYEIAEQLGWRTPQHVVSPAAGGSLINKIYKSFKEFEKFGLVGPVETKMYCAQAEGCSPISTMIMNKAEVMKPVKPHTIAKSLAIGNPADGYYAKDVCLDSGGGAQVAKDQEIIDSIKLLASTEGIFTETAGGVTLACAKKLIDQGSIPKDESIVLCITGQGLKTQEAIADHLSRPHVIDPTLSSFEERVDFPGKKMENKV